MYLQQTRFEICDLSWVKGAARVMAELLDRLKSLVAFPQCSAAHAQSLEVPTPVRVS